MRRKIPAHQAVEQDLLLVAHRTFLERKVFGGHVEHKHKPVRSLELLRLGSLFVRFQFVGHHDEAVVARRAPVLDVLGRLRILSYEAHTRTTAFTRV